MASIFAFKCSCCGKIHEGSPGFSFRAPDQYLSLSEQQKAEMGRINDDFCIITHEEGTDHFVRAILEIPIHGVQEPFIWGVWVSVSQKSFDRYRETYDDPVEGETFFGWVCNQIKLYPYHKTRATDVVVQSGRARPLLILHRGDSEDDPMVIDQVNGISVARAQELAEWAAHGV